MTTAMISGLAVGSIYALIAIGYNITHLASGVLNFAQAHLMVLGIFLSVWMFDHGVTAFVVVPACGVIVALVALLEERLAIRPLRALGAHSELVTTLGFATLITGVIIVVAGSDPRVVHFPISNDSFRFLGGRVQPVDLALIVVALGAAAIVALLLRRTRLGVATLAQSADREAALLRGIDVRRLSMIGFLAAGMLAGLVGPLVGDKTYAAPSLGLLLAVKGFVVMCLGGLGSIEGAWLGGLVVGVLEVLASRYAGTDYRDLATFVVFAALLLSRPQGLFGTTSMRMV
jgi:branched-chain amino acid transport system permease protein